ncbi:MAG TPA: EVE domain-containing protein [Thermoanaerobaculia bacterium]
MAQRLTPYKSGVNYWLLAVDPDEYSFQDLRRDTRTVWRYVKDYASLNHLRDVESDEQTLIFHTGTELAIIGVARFISDPYPDPQGTGADEQVVDVVPERLLERPVRFAEFEDLPELQDWDFIDNPDLSCVPVPPEVWERLLQMVDAPLVHSTQESQA